jgi:uncharacterized protein YbjT (DUF2867 family)
MKKVLIAGATGYLGRYLVLECKKQGHWVRALTRNTKKLDDLSDEIDELFKAEVTQAASLKGICDDIDVVISSIGITRQRDGLTYMDVDYQGNKNLLDQAVENNVSKFMYVSVLNAHRMKELKGIQTKLLFEEKLKASGLDYTIIRPNGFFSDMTELLNMAQKGTVYLFGNGMYKGNPIHGEDLAEYIVQKMDSCETDLEIGGPDILTQNQMSRAAFTAVGKKEKIVYIPLWIKNVTLKLVRWFTSQKIYGPIEFFMNVMTMDMVASTYGKHHLNNFYSEETNKV